MVAMSPFCKGTVPNSKLHVFWWLNSVVPGWRQGASGTKRPRPATGLQGFSGSLIDVLSSHFDNAWYWFHELVVM